MEGSESGAVFYSLQFALGAMPELKDICLCVAQPNVNNQHNSDAGKC